jgi:murein L,D-transpeptidase YcbB/YkuD
MDIFKFLPLLMRILQLLPQIQDSLRVGTPVLALLQKFSPDLVSIVQGVGGVLFPTLSPQAQVEVGALTTFDQVQVRWIQSTLNSLKIASPLLEVDGQYGLKTKVAVAAFQSKHGLQADGWAGKITSAAMQTELNKLPVPKA